MREYEIERMARDARLGPIGGGTDEVMKEILGKARIWDVHLGRATHDAAGRACSLRVLLARAPRARLVGPSRVRSARRRAGGELACRPTSRRRHPVWPGPPSAARPRAISFPALMVDLSRRARTRAVTAAEVEGAVDATCAKGTSASLKAFIRERLPEVDVSAAALFGRVVALINAQCPLAPGQVLALESAAVAELALNGMRASAHGAIRERELNDQACR